MGKENDHRFFLGPSSENDSGFETVLKNHAGFLIPLELVRPQIIRGRNNARRMWGPLIAEREHTAVVWYADPLETVRLAHQDRPWVAHHPIPFPARHPIYGTEDFSSGEIALLTTEHPLEFPLRPEGQEVFFRKFKEDARFREDFLAMVTKACQEVDRLLT
jgi:hypothetical protein